MKKVLFVVSAALLLGGTTAQAQLVMNGPVTAPHATITVAPRGGVAGAPPSTAVMASEGTKTIVAPEDRSTVPLVENGIVVRGKSYADDAPVKAFDGAEGTLTLTDDLVLTVPKNFALTAFPEPGQPITAYYVRDFQGRAVLQQLVPGEDDGAGNG